MGKELTEMQTRYCDLKMEGLSSNDAARQAGYQPSAQGRYDHATYRSVVIQRELARRMDEGLTELGPKVLANMTTLLESKCESIRFKATRDLADRMGIGESEVSQQAINVVIDLS